MLNFKLCPSPNFLFSTGIEKSSQQSKKAKQRKAEEYFIKKVFNMTSPTKVNVHYAT